MDSTRAVLRIAAALASILLMMTTCGCWDALDIDRRAFVAVMGLDSDVSGEGHRPRVSLMIPMPGGGGEGGAGGGGAGGGEEMTAKMLVVDETGVNAEEAVQKVRAMVGGVIDFSTLQYVVTSTDASPDDLTGAMHTVQFTRFIPMTPFMFATEQKASDLLRAESPSGKSFVDTLDGIQAQSRLGLGHVHYPQAWETMSMLINKTGDMTLTLINSTDRGDGLEAVGAAVYDGAKYAGTLAPTDALMLQCVALRRYSGGTYLFRGDDHELLIRIIRARTKVEVDRGNADALRFRVSMRVNAVLMDSGGYRLPLLNRRKLDELEQVAARDMEARLGRLLERLQGWNSDAMRLYHEARVKMPEMSCEDFKRVYPGVKAEFSVSMLLVRTGLLR
jgi:Ger(x)C family germination protein